MSEDELHGAYRDSAEVMLQGATAGFMGEHNAGALGSAARLRAELRRWPQSIPSSCRPRSTAPAAAPR